MADTEAKTEDFDPFAEPKAKPRRGGSFLGLLALLVALAVAGWNGWQWWQAQSGDDATAELARTISALEQSQAQLVAAQQRLGQQLEAFDRPGLESGLAELDVAIEEARSVAGSDRARLEGLEASFAEVAGLMDRLESRVAAIVVRGESPRQALELAEVDYLLRSATERLNLYGDARTADQALSLADAQLEAMDDPVYLTVRQAIAAARLSLESVEQPDQVALTERLSRLQAQLSALPFPGEVLEMTPAGPVTTEDPGVWSRLTSALGDLVTVRRSDDDLLLVSLEDKDTVRQALWLQLEAARLALLREDDAAYRAALGRAEATLDQYFDATAPAVTRFAASLGTLLETQLSVDWPDISEPWTRLKSIREPAAERSAAPTAEIPAAPPAAAAPADEARPMSTDQETDQQNDQENDPEANPETDPDAGPAPGPGTNPEAAPDEDEGT